MCNHNMYARGSRRHRMSVSSISKVYSRQRIFRQVNGEYLFETSSAAISLSRLFRSLKSTFSINVLGK